MKIAIISSEVWPISKTGGLGDYAYSLASAIASAGHGVDVITPSYGDPEGEMESAVEVNGKEIEFRRRKMDGFDAVTAVSAELFGRKEMYGYEDDARRFAYFGKASAAYAAKREYDIVHCNDWQTGYVPLLLNQMNSAARSVFTIHNLEFQGNSPPSILDEIGVSREHFNIEGVEFYGSASAMKAGIVYSDSLVTVSPTYSREIQTPEYGFGMDGIIRRHSGKLTGILNGIDCKVWNPSADPEVKTGFDAARPEAKAQCRSSLQREFSLPQVRRPLISFIGRLWKQKGIDLLMDALPYVKGTFQLIVLGTGDKELMHRLEMLAAVHPSYRTIMRYDEHLAHRMYAGSDMFVMPSRFEPCGLGQMISMRYGTVPIVRRTGGLADTVSNYDPETDEGSGFMYSDNDPLDLAGAISTAIKVYASREKWSGIVSRCMKRDFSWEASAGTYVDLYSSLTKQEIKAS